MWPFRQSPVDTKANILPTQHLIHSAKIHQKWQLWEKHQKQGESGTFILARKYPPNLVVNFKFSSKLFVI